jgi:hypothetical protein
VNGLPKRRLAVTNRGRAIAKHPAVYSPIGGNPGYFLASGGYFAEFGRKRRRKRQSHVAASAPFHLSCATTTLNQKSCNFVYMNRFIDGLRLLSEDEAIKTYHEAYGKSFEEFRKAKG